MEKRETIETTIADLSNTDPLKVIKALDRLYNEGIPASRSFEQIISFISDQNWKIRAKSARCLEFTDSRTDAAVTALTGALSDPVARVQINTALALGIIGGKSSPDILAAAVIALRNALHDSRPSVRLIVGKTLKSLGYEAEGEKAIQEWHNRIIEKKLPNRSVKSVISKMQRGLKNNASWEDCEMSTRSGHLTGSSSYPMNISYAGKGPY